MTGSDPERPPQQFQGYEYPSLESSSPQRHDPYAPVDYPADAGLPPPVYPNPPGYYQPPAYNPGWGYDPYRPPKPPGTNGMAIASLVVSVASIVLFCGIPSFVGVILGVSAIRQTRRTGQDGFGVALAGIIVGAIPIVIWLLYLLVFVGIFASSWQ